MTDRSAGFFSDLVGDLEDMENPALRADASHGLFSAEWALLDYPLGPLSSEAAGAVEGMRLIDILDIGFVDDERRCHYSTYARIAGAKISPTAKKGMINGREILDVGRVIYGYEAFRINCIPHRPLRIVLRLSHRVTAETDTPPRGTRYQDLEFGWPQELLVFVDGQPLDVMSFAEPTDSADFHDIVFDVPATYIAYDTATISVGGDHASFGYWFYQ